MNFKWIFLFFLLGLPVSIYLFLQGFGENQFVVQVFYENGVVNPVDGCDGKSGEQFFVPLIDDSLAMSKFDQSGIVVYDITAPVCDSCQFKIDNLISLSSQFYDGVDVKFVSLVGGRDSGLYPAPRDNWVIVNLTDSILHHYANCGLNLRLDLNKYGQLSTNGIVVLVDSKRRVRGYYNLFDLEEADRLSTELKIIRKYEDNQ